VSLGNLVANLAMTSRRTAQRARPTGLAQLQDARGLQSAVHTTTDDGRTGKAKRGGFVDDLGRTLNSMSKSVMTGPHFRPIECAS
jgi:hypothetical protein